MPRQYGRASSPAQSASRQTARLDAASTTLLQPGQRCAADRLGNLLIETGA